MTTKQDELKALNLPEENFNKAKLIVDWLEENNLNFDIEDDAMQGIAIWIYSNIDSKRIWMCLLNQCNRFGIMFIENNIPLKTIPFSYDDRQEILNFLVQNGRKSSNL